MALAVANSKPYARSSLFVVGLMFVLPFLQPFYCMLEYPLCYSFFLGVAALLLGFGAERMSLISAVVPLRGVVAVALLVGWVNLLALLSLYREVEVLAQSRPEEFKPLLKLTSAKAAELRAGTIAHE